MEKSNSLIRINRNALHIQIAELISKRATCGRLSVGAVATIDNRIVANGYNGPPPGHPHCSDYFCDMTKPCTRALHAERNLLDWAIQNNVDLRNTTLYITHSPCLDCAKLIAFCGIKEVYYLNSYRLDDGPKFLENHGIKVIRITRDGAEISEAL